MADGTYRLRDPSTTWPFAAAAAHLEAWRRHRADVFIKIHARPAGPPDPAGALAYLRQAVVNGCRSWQRRQAVARRLGSADRSAADIQESAEHSVITAENRRRLQAELSALPIRRREVLVLRYYLGFSEAEIARTLGISRGAVKSAAARGIRSLARALGEES